MISISPYIGKKSLLWIKGQDTKGQQQENSQEARKGSEASIIGKGARQEGTSLYIPKATHNITCLSDPSNFRPAPLWARSQLAELIAEHKVRHVPVLRACPLVPCLRSSRRPYRQYGYIISIPKQGCETGRVIPSFEMSIGTQ